jgi:hypothetical protein
MVKRSRGGEHKNGWRGEIACRREGNNYSKMAETFLLLGEEFLAILVRLFCH